MLVSCWMIGLSGEISVTDWRVAGSRMSQRRISLSLPALKIVMEVPDGESSEMHGSMAKSSIPRVCPRNVWSFSPVEIFQIMRLASELPEIR